MDYPFGRLVPGFRQDHLVDAMRGGVLLVYSCMNAPISGGRLGGFLNRGI